MSSCVGQKRYGMARPVRNRADDVRLNRPVKKLSCYALETACTHPYN